MKSANIKTARRWFVAVGASAFLVIGAGGASAGVLDRIKQDKTIRLAVRDDAAPFSYKDPAGQHVGFMVDLCRGVAKEIGARLGAELKVDYVTVTAADRFEAIETGKADLLCEPTTETLTRREHVDFLDPDLRRRREPHRRRQRAAGFRGARGQEDRRAGRHYHRNRTSQYAEGERNDG